MATADNAAGTVTLHRYSAQGGNGDLRRADLAVLWGLMLDEGLTEIFFHDGAVRNLAEFQAYAARPDQWFYAAKKNGLFIGIGVANGFTSNGNTAFTHLLSFRCGRDGSFAEAGRLWFELLAGPGGLRMAIAVVPRCYRGVRRWAESFGFVRALLLPRALKLHRRGRERVTDGCVYVKALVPCNT